MCTITLSYDQNNALARRKLAIKAHLQEREMFLNHSKKSMSNIIARYL